MNVEPTADPGARGDAATGAPAAGSPGPSGPGLSAAKSRFLPVVLLLLAAAIPAACAGYAFTGPFARFIVGTHHGDVELRPADPGERRRVSARFALATAFAATATVVAAVLSRPAASLPSVVGRASLLGVVAALAFACAAVYCRHQFSAFVLEVGAYASLFRRSSAALRRPEVLMSDLPLARVPAMAGLSVLVAGAVVRAITLRVRAGTRRI
jgi:hypothetical protein